jgi:hypothetical protein
LPSNRLALRILSISVFVEFVCLCVQLLLITCVFYLFSIFSCNPSFISAAHPSATSCAHLSCSRLSVAPSLFRVAVGKKRKESSKKRNKKNKKERPLHIPSGKQELIRLGEGVLRRSSPGSQAFWAAPCMPW